MNILHLSAVKNWGGGGNHIENLCYELSKSNPEVRNFIVVAEKGQFYERLKEREFNFFTVPMSMNIDPRAIIKFIRLCKKEKIDLVHIHGSTSLTLAVMACYFAKLPPFIFSKKTSFPIKKRKQTLFKYNHPQIKKILCVSEKTKEITRPAILDPNKLCTIYHGTRLDHKSIITPFKLRVKFSIAPNRRIIGHIGNHIRAKDLDTFVETINVLVNEKNHKNLVFIQIGTFTDQTPSIKNRIKELNLEEYVYFLGYLPNASNFMAQFNLLIITSKSEGLPQVIYEAAYHKVPVVSTNVGGIPEFIEDGYNGLLCNKEDAVALAGNIEILLEDKEKATNFALRSYVKLIPGFTSEFMAQATLQEYYKAIHKKTE